MTKKRLDLKRNLVILGVLLCVISVTLLFRGPDPAMRWQDAEVYLYEEAPYARVYRNGELLFQSSGEGRHYQCFTVDLGDSPHPELILLGDYGGTYPVRDVAILDGESGRVVFQAEEACYPEVADFNGDGQLQFGMRDDTVGSHKEYPLVLFQVRNKALEVARDSMLGLPTPSKEELASLGADHACAHGPSDQDRAILIDLWYRGRADLAHLFLHQIPGTDIGFHEKRLHEELKQSPYWFEIEQLNQRDIITELCPCVVETLAE